MRSFLTRTVFVAVLFSISCSNSPGTDLTNSNDRDLCGNGAIDTGENCDSDALGENSCTGLGYTKGVLKCTDVCAYDVSDCSTCGNEWAEGEFSTAVGYEVCDGPDIRGKTCTDLGRSSGILRCSPTCGWDFSGCTVVASICGNGVVEGLEECDDGNQDTTDACPDGPEGNCVVAYCGDGFVHAGVEGCDDGNGINLDICPDGVGGTCQLAACGDGFIYAASEECDDGDDNSDTLPGSCRTYCKEAYCGDGVKDSNEVCDGADFGLTTCTDMRPTDPQGFLMCNSGCQTINPVNCSQCGDGYCNYATETSAAGWPHCFADCCGDSVCDPISETTSNCPLDCSSSYCGNGICGAGEDSCNCNFDCDPPTTCNPMTSDGCCGGSEGCYYETGSFTCMSSGIGSEGQICLTHNQCESGYSCTLMSIGDYKACYEVCKSTADCASWSCQDVGVHIPGYGVCKP